MADEERCPIFPSMLKAYCSHCQGTARGTPGNPKFSLKEDIYNGFPVVEVLRDGAAIHPWDDHFRFGRRRAELLLACIEVLRDFWKTNGDESDRFVPHIIENRRHRLRVRVFVEKHPDFERSNGETVERSWLRLQALPPDNEHIGLGVIKAFRSNGELPTKQEDAGEMLPRSERRGDEEDANSAISPSNCKSSEGRPAENSRSVEGTRVGALLRDSAGPESQKAWIFQANPQLSDVRGAIRSVKEPICLVQQFKKEIKPGDRVYL